MGARISVTNTTEEPMGFKVFTTGRGFVVGSAMVNSRQTSEVNCERVWYEVVLNIKLI
jgi:altronate dehydratase